MTLVINPPPLPEPDTHCWDDDTRRDNWSYSADQLREYGAACVAQQHTRILEWLDAALDDPDVCWPAEVDILRDQIVRSLHAPTHGTREEKE